MVYLYTKYGKERLPSLVLKTLYIKHIDASVYTSIVHFIIKVLRRDDTRRHVTSASCCY